MELEKQCCTLEQAKRLSELGIEQFKSLFRWCVFCPDPLGENYYYEIVFGDGLENAFPGEFIADAFTVAELLTMLPMCIVANADGKFYATPDEYHNYDIDNIVMPEGWDNTKPDPWYRQSTQAAWCLADLAIFLLENNIITPSDCNNRLNA